MRADKVLSALFEGEFSRSQMQKGFAMKQITVANLAENHSKAHASPKYYPRRGDIFTVNVQSIPSTLPPDFRPLEIVFENSDFLIVNKDAGINTHPTASYHGKFGTLVNQLVAQVSGFDRAQGEDRPGIIHRLDKDTSGLLIVAKNDHTLRDIQRLIHDHKVQKTYLALVVGEPKDQTGTIQSHIGRDPNERTKMTHKNPVEAREAITHYEILETFEVSNQKGGPGKLSLIQLNLETGRTHQIRVHMTAIGHPIVGDSVYGDKIANSWAEKEFGLTRQFLHAWKLDFEYLDQKYSFQGPLKEDLKKVLGALHSKMLD